MKTKYEILVAPSAPRLIEQVDEYLRRGWVLVGGVATYYDPELNSSVFSQGLSVALAEHEKP